MINYLVKSKLKDLSHSWDLKIRSEAIMIIDGRIEEILKKAAKRAKANHRKTIMPYDVLGPKKPKGYIVKSKIKDFSHQVGLNISSKAIIIIEGRIEEILKKAAKRAKANHRKTIMPYDV